MLFSFLFLFVLVLFVMSFCLTNDLLFLIGCVIMFVIRCKNNQNVVTVQQKLPKCWNIYFLYVDVILEYMYCFHIDCILIVLLPK
jgi:hypothetical protein